MELNSYEIARNHFNDYEEWKFEKEISLFNMQSIQEFILVDLDRRKYI